MVKGYRSFCSLAEGKAVCILEAPDKESVAAWSQKMGMPTDSITALELEGKRGVVQRAYSLTPLPESSSSTAAE